MDDVAWPSYKLNLRAFGSDELITGLIQVTRTVATLFIVTSCDQPCPILTVKMGQGWSQEVTINNVATVRVTCMSPVISSSEEPK